MCLPAGQVSPTQSIKLGHFWQRQLPWGVTPGRMRTGGSSAGRTTVPPPLSHPQSQTPGQKPSLIANKRLLLPRPHPNPLLPVCPQTEEQLLQKCTLLLSLLPCPSPRQALRTGPHSLRTHTGAYTDTHMGVHPGCTHGLTGTRVRTRARTHTHTLSCDVASSPPSALGRADLILAEPRMLQGNVGQGECSIAGVQQPLDLYQMGIFCIDFPY